jgi:DNA polymerase-3 subunit alpha
LSIKDGGYEKTYDLSIDQNHSFVVGGHVVHNCYQEDYALISRKIGNLSLGDGVNLVKAISKKKVDKIRKFKDKFYAGAKKNGCPGDVADRIWSIIEGGASYGFNKSHAASYGATAYVGAYIKALYPVVFYTVLLKWGKDENIVQILSEMRELGNVTILHPDINISSDDFETDYKKNEIYWSILRIKFVGAAMVEYILKERKRHGDFVDLQDFIKRIFKNKFKKYNSFDDEDNEDEYKRCPVNARAVKNLILSGAFDRIEALQSVTDRYFLLQEAAELLGFKMDEKLVPTELRDKHYFWAQQQINLAGIGNIDFERIFNDEGLPSSMSAYPYFPLESMQLSSGGERKVGICAIISECEEKSFKDKKTGEKKWYGKIVLQQNIDMASLVIWNDAWTNVKQYFMHKKNSIVIFAGIIKWSDYEEKNILQINKNSFVTNV